MKVYTNECMHILSQGISIHLQMDDKNAYISSCAGLRIYDILLHQVWEEQDHMSKEEFKPEIFFHLHGKYLVVFLNGEFIVH